MDNDFKKFWIDNYSVQKVQKKKKFNEGRDFMDSQDTTKDDFDNYEGGEGGNIDSPEQPHKPLKPENKTPRTKKGIDFSKFKGVNKDGQPVDFEITGGIPFQFIIEKACASESGQMETRIVKDFNGNTIREETLPEHMIVEGLASTTNVDHDEERMAPEALKAMVDCIDKGGVQLRSEHSKEWDGLLGGITKGWIDDRGQFHIRAELNKDSSKSIDLYRALKNGAQLGLSIAGIVKRAGLEMAETLGRKVKTFYDVLLKEVSVTNRPSNFDTWLVAKKKNKNDPGIADFYKQYLSENKKLDWQYSIAKSIPDEFLKQTNYKITNNNMNEKDLKMAKSIAMKAVEDAFKGMEKGCGKADDTTDDSTTDETDKAKDDTTETESTKGIKMESTKQTIHTKKEDSSSDSESSNGSDSSESDNSDSSDSSSDSESTSKSQKSEVDMNVLTKVMTDIVEKSLLKHGKRVLNLELAVEKFLKQPNERKAKAFIVEKNTKIGEDEEVNKSKDLADKDVSFQDYFKKNLSSK
jgi:hypothetical protein